MDVRVCTKIEGFDAEVDLDLILSEARYPKSEYGVALVLEGPLAGYEVLLSPYSLNKLQEQWEKDNE